MNYEPRVDPIQHQRIRRWHDRAYDRMSRDEDIEVAWLGLTLRVPPQVFAPPPMPPLLSLALRDEVGVGDRVLDMGTGSGVNAILAAAKASEVVAVDINPHAVACARANAEANGVANRVTTLESDVFDAVDGEFDLIIFDPPFRWFRPRDLLEAAIADEGYRALTRFMAEAPSYLAPGGRVLIDFGTSADLAYLEELIDHHDYRKTTLRTFELTQDGWTVQYFVFRLTRP